MVCKSDLTSDLSTGAGHSLIFFTFSGSGDIRTWKTDYRTRVSQEIKVTFLLPERHPRCLQSQQHVFQPQIVLRASPVVLYLDDTFQALQQHQPCHFLALTAGRVYTRGGAFYLKVEFEISTQGDPILWYLQIPKT